MDSCQPPPFKHEMRRLRTHFASSSSATSFLSVPIPKVKLTLRPPPNVDFVHGYPGIPPGGPGRPQAVAKGVIEVRGPAQGVKAKWVRIELRKVETMPGGGPSNTFYDFVGPSPVNVWTAQGEYGALQNQDFHFSIPIPESIPPTVALDNRAEISYKLIASVCTRGERSWFGRVKSSVVSTEAPIIIDKHDLHSQWPVYCQHEERNLSQDGVNLLVERESTCFGPGDTISIAATLKSDSLRTIILRAFKLQLIETTAFRHGAYAAGKKAIPQTKTAIICQGETTVNATLCGGIQRKANISCNVPPNHTTTTLNTARYIDVTYTLQVKAMMGTVHHLSIDLPVIASNWQRHVSIAAIRRIGPVPKFSLIAASTSKGGHSSSIDLSDQYSFKTLTNQSTSHLSRPNVYVAPLAAPTPTSPVIERQPISTRSVDLIPSMTTSAAPRYLTAEQEKAALKSRYEQAEHALAHIHSPKISDAATADSLPPSFLDAFSTSIPDAPTAYATPPPFSASAPLPLNAASEEEALRRMFQAQEMANTTTQLQPPEQRAWNTSVNETTMDIDLFSRQYEYKPVNLSGFIICDKSGASGGGGMNVAIKVIRSHIYKDDNKWKITKRLRREIRMWGSLQHSNILPLLGITFDFGPHEAMVCPWMEDGDLDPYLDREQKTLKLYNRFDILNDVTEGLLYLHSKAIIHGDLTSANVLLNNSTACLCDFGLSSLIAEFQILSLLTSTVGGACRWAAPELYSFESETEMKPTITKACDIYSFGSIVLQVISGQRPYGEIQRNEQVMLELFRLHLPQRPLEPLLDDSCWDFINLCWRIDPTRRPDVTSVRDQLRILRSEYDAEQLLRTLTVR